MPAARYGIVDPRRDEATVPLSNGGTVAITAHCGYTDSRDAAQEAAARVGGVFVEREGPTWAQRGAFALMLARCRACDEGVCTLRSHVAAGG